MYYNIYNILHQYIFESAEITSHIDLTLTIVSTALTLFVVAIPFLIVYKFVRWI